MKIVKMRCPSCGAHLKIDETHKKGYCEHCGTEVLIDDEVQHVQYDNVEEAGYNFEKGRIKAQEEKIREEQEARERAEKEKALKRQQELERFKAEQEQRRIANQRKKSKTSKILLIVTLSLAKYAEMYEAGTLSWTQFCQKKEEILQREYRK